MSTFRSARHLALRCLLFGVLLPSTFLAACITPQPPGPQDEGPPPVASQAFEGLHVADGIAFLLTGTALSALQADTGTLLWRFQGNLTQNRGAESPLAVANGMIYLYVNVTQASDSELGEWVYALRGTDGKQLWRFHLSSTFSQLLPPEPRVLAGAVFVETAGENDGDTLYVLRASDGHLLWSQEPSSDFDHESPHLQAVVEGTAYLTSHTAAGDDLLARRLSDGKVLWQYRTPACYIEAVQFLEGSVYISDTGLCAGHDSWGRVYALRASDGQLLWSFAPGGILTVTPEIVCVDDTDDSSPGVDKLFVVQTSTGQLLWHSAAHKAAAAEGIWVLAAEGTAVYETINQRFSAVDARTGQALWTFPTPVVPLAELRQGVPLSNGVWYLPTSVPLGSELQPALAAVQASGGALIWSRSIQDPRLQWDALTMTEGALYLSSGSDLLYAIRASDGTLLWSAQQPGEILNFFVVAGRVYVVVRSGDPSAFTARLIARETRAGQVLWTFPPAG